MSSLPDLYNASIEALQQGLDAGHFTSVHLTKAYLARIDEVNSSLRVVIATNSRALQDAARLDLEREQGVSRGALHGIPLLFKDTINTGHELGTTSGSFAMLGAMSKDAYAVSKLRDAGAIILGKCNLGSWNNARSMGQLPNGWSAVGGLTKSVFFTDSSPGGSNSGATVATTIGLCSASVGGETNASLMYPAHICNVVGLRPTLGLISRRGVSPISSTYDTLGPVTRSVRDAAILLTVMAGPDPLDRATLSQPPRPDYLRCLHRTDLKGVRIGFPRSQLSDLWSLGEIPQEIQQDNDQALAILERLGAKIIDIEFDDPKSLLDRTALHRIAALDGPDDMEEYLKTFTVNPNNIQTIKDIVEYGRTHPDLEFPHGLDAQDYMEKIMNGPRRSAYPLYGHIREQDFRQTRKAITRAFAKHNVSCVVYPTVLFTAFVRCGFPQIVVPLGFRSESTEAVLQSHGPDSIPFEKPEIRSFASHPRQPYGISFSGLAFSERKLLSVAYAFEQASRVRDQKRALPEYTPKTSLQDVMGQ